MLDFIYIYCIYIYLPLTEWIMISQYGWLTTIIFSTALNPGRQSQFSQTPGRADFNVSETPTLGVSYSSWLGQETCELLLRNLTSGWHWSLKEVETCGDLWTSVDKVRFSFKLLVKQPIFQFGTSWILMNPHDVMAISAADGPEFFGTCLLVRCLVCPLVWTRTLMLQLRCVAGLPRTRGKFLSILTFQHCYDIDLIPLLSSEQVSYHLPIISTITISFCQWCVDQARLGGQSPHRRWVHFWRSIWLAGVALRKGVKVEL